MAKVNLQEFSTKKELRESIEDALNKIEKLVKEEDKKLVEKKDFDELKTKFDEATADLRRLKDEVSTLKDELGKRAETKELTELERKVSTLI